MNELKRSAARGAMWAYASKYSGKLLVFISTLILARLLILEDFGVAGYALVVIAFMETLSGLGMKPALIYYEDEPATKDTAFYLGLLAAVFLFILTWLAAPLMADFFRDPRATDVTRALALTLPITALGNIHFALLEKHLEFGKKFIPDLSNALTKGLVSIAFALSGFGAWSLIYGQLAGTLCGVIAVWLVLPWRPTFRFNRRMAPVLLSFGSKIIVVGLLGFFVTNTGYFLVGRYLGAAVLGIYVLSLRVPDVLIREAALVMNRVLFPVFAKVKDDRSAIGRGYLFVLRYMCLIVVPLGLGLSAVAEPFVISLLTQKWAEAIPVIRLSGIYMLLLAIAFSFGTVFKAIGRPGIIIKLSTLRLVLLMPAVTWAVLGPATLVAVVWVQLIVVTLHLVIGMFVVAKVLRISMKQIVDAMWPAFVTGGIMYVAVVAVVGYSQDLNSFMQLVLGIGSGVVIYAGLIWWWQKDVVMKGYEQLRAATRAKEQR